MAEYGRSSGRSDDRSACAVDDVKAWLETEAMPRVAEIKAQMTQDERQTASDRLFARANAAVAIDEAVGHEPTTPVQVAVAETLAELTAAPSREKEDEILGRFRARSKGLVEASAEHDSTK